MKQLILIIIATMFVVFTFGQNQEYKNQSLSVQKQFNKEEIINLKSGGLDEIYPDSIIFYIFNMSDSTYSYGQRDDYYYDANGNQVLNIHSGWDNSSEKWFVQTKTENTYNENGNLTSALYSNWVDSTSQWIKRGKGEYYNDLEGNDTLYVYSDWDTVLSDWVKKQMTISEFNEAGKTLMNIICTRNNPDAPWDSIYKNEVFLNESGLDTMVLFHTWDINTASWKLGDKHNDFHDEVGKDTARIISIFSSEFNHWEFSYKIVWMFDISGMDSVTASYSYDKLYHLWINSTRFETVLDPENHALVHRYQYMWSEDQWELLSLTNFYYPEDLVSGIINTTGNEIRVYPNPAREFIAFDLKDKLTPATIELYTIQGNKVLTQRISDKEQISTGNLSRGLYLYRIIQNGSNASGKLIIE